MIWGYPTSWTWSELTSNSPSPRNVVCKTAHGLAYAVYGSQHAAKQTNNLRLTDIARAINTQDWELVRDVLITAATSNDDSIWKQAMALQEDISALCSCLTEIRAASLHPIECNHF